MPLTRRKELNKKIAKALILDWIIYRFPWRLILVFTLITGIMGIFLFDPKIPGSELTGIAIGLHGPQSETPGPSKLIVKLDSGDEIIVGGSGSILLKKSQRVVVRLYTSEFLGLKRYKFIRYLDE